MTVVTQTAVITVSGDGSTTQFGFPFEVPYQANGSTPAVAVWTVVGGVYVLLDEGVDYSVSGIGAATGGFVNYPLVGGALPEGDFLVIARDLDYTQSSAFTNTGFLPTSMEFALDLMTMQYQQLAAGLAGALRAEPGETVVPYVSASLRAGKVAGFDGFGQPTVVGPGSYTVDAATLSFPTLAAAMAADIAGGTPFVQLVGQQAVGDCLPALYVPASAGAALGKFQSADGQWWAVTGSDVGCPEWFGAISNLSGFDCEPALTACFTQFAVMELQDVRYYIANTFQMSLPNKTIRGRSLNVQGGDTSEACTQIVINSATQDCALVGFTSQPVSQSQFLQGVSIFNVAFNRSMAPTPPVSGILGGPAGLRIAYVNNFHGTLLGGNESYYGFYYTGVIASYMDNCAATRKYAGSTGTNDNFFGHFLDCSAMIGDVGGIASLYMNRCSASGGAALFAPTSSSAAVYTYDGFSDIYIHQFECSATVNGMIFNQASGEDSEDLHVERCVMDSITGCGFQILGNGTYPVVFDISGCYTAIHGGYSNAACFKIDNVAGGHGVIRGGQLVGDNATPVIGVWLTGGSPLIDLIGVLMTEVSRPIVAAGAFSGKWDINATCDFATGYDAISVSTTTRAVIEPRLNLTSGAAAWVNGVNITDAGSGFNEVRVTGINPTACSGHKLVYIGTPITAETAIAGQFGNNNIARGVFA